MNSSLRDFNESRRSLIKKCFYSCFLLLAVVGCGSSNGGKSEPDVTDDECGTGAGVAYTNPGHSHTTIPLSSSNMNDAIPGNYTVLGGGHSHTVNLTSQDFTDLENGMTVTKNDLEGHLHDISIKC